MVYIFLKDEFRNEVAEASYVVISWYCSGIHASDSSADNRARYCFREWHQVRGI